MTAVPITLAKLFAWDSLSQAAGRRDDGHEPLIRVRGSLCHVGCYPVKQTVVW